MTVTVTVTRHARPPGFCFRFKPDAREPRRAARAARISIFNLATLGAVRARARAARNFFSNFATLGAHAADHVVLILATVLAAFARALLGYLPRTTVITQFFRGGILIPPVMAPCLKVFE